jgi:5'-nucleotidase
MQKILYIDMDNVLVDFPSARDRLADGLWEQYEGNQDEIPDVFSLMDPMPGAIAAYEKLSGMFDTYVLSTAPWENHTAWSDKLLWIKKHLGTFAYKRLILTHHKNLNQGDYLVDDRTKNGADRFAGEHIHFGTEKFPDWAAVTEYLREGIGD